MKLNNIYNMDCLHGMKEIPDNSIDLIFSDLPYAMTDCEWDNIIPFAPLWEEYKRIRKENAAIVLFSAQPFTTKVIQSNLKEFRYCWYWIKNVATGFTFAKYQPMRRVEDICVFYRKHGTYNPQGLEMIENPKKKKRAAPKNENIYDMKTLSKEYVTSFKNYPKNTLYFDRETKRYHPTQKPVELCEYIIKTYTNKGETVLDNCAGSGSILLAAKNTERNFIGFEKNRKYYEIAKNRCVS